MAKVYTGKVTITIDSIDDYVQMLEEAEKQRKPFRDQLFKLLDNFQFHLEEKYSVKTARKHVSVTKLFIDFICEYTDVNSIQEITRGMVNTHFKKWWKRKVWDSTSESELRVALKKFFTFLAEEQDIINEKVLIALR